MISISNPAEIPETFFMYFEHSRFIRTICIMNSFPMHPKKSWAPDANQVIENPRSLLSLKAVSDGRETPFYSHIKRTSLKVVK